MPALRARVLLIAAVCMVLVAAAPARGAQRVSYDALLQQVKSGPLLRAVINRAGGDIEIKFKNLSEWKAFYPPGAQPMLQRLLHERHIRVIFASRHHARSTRSRSVHHHLRYIAAAILGALALASVAFAYLRRRRTRPPAHGEAAAS
jgi:hypothetical protein